MKERIIVDDDLIPEWQRDNRAAWDAMAASGHPLAKPATAEQFADPVKAVDGNGWLGNSVRGKRVLCLAAGGGRHGPLYAAAGAEVTIVDLSPQMLQIDRKVAAGRGLFLKTLQSSMEDLGGLEPDYFDVVVQPVSSCYVPDIFAVYQQVAIVIRSGGLYISQHKQPASLQSSLVPDNGKYVLETPYYRQGPLTTFRGKSAIRENGATEFLHRWEEIVGGLCRAGFVVEDLIEPFHADENAAAGSKGHRGRFVPPYVRIKARRRTRSEESVSDANC